MIQWPFLYDNPETYLRSHSNYVFFTLLFMYKNFWVHVQIWKFLYKSIRNKLCLHTAGYLSLSPCNHIPYIIMFLTKWWTLTSTQLNKIRWKPNCTLRFCSYVFIEIFGFRVSFLYFLTLKWFCRVQWGHISRIVLTGLLSVSLFVAGAAVCLHQLLVWSFLSGCCGKLWLCSLSWQ